MSKFFILTIGLISAGAQAGELSDLVNSVRERGSRCGSAAGLAPFVMRPALDQAAAAIARGAPLIEAAGAAGYRAAKVQVITLSGTLERGKVQTVLAGRFCTMIADRALTDIGVYQRGADAWIVLAAPFGPRSSVDQGEAGRRVLALVNKARSVSRRCGDAAFAPAPPVRWNEVLARVARAHSEDMAGRNYFGHDAPGGPGAAERVKRAGYRYRSTAENIAAGQTKPEDVVAGWVKSPHHCVNLMNPVYTDMGVAYASASTSEFGLYWTQVFGTPLR